MLQQDNELGNLQKILLKIMLILVALSFVLCAICLAYIWSETNDVREAFTFAVVVLVASIPLAIEIVTTATLALGSRELSALGAIVTRLMAIEELAGMNMLCSDKTGTLTLNKMVIQEDTPVYTAGEDQRTILVWAALAAKWNEPPRDALDTLVLNAVDLTECDKYEQIDYVPFDPTVKRTEGTLRRDGKQFKTTKGAPHIILKLIHEKEKVERAVEMKVNELGKRGIRSLAVAKTDDDGHWRFMGILTFLDPPRPDTKVTLERAMEFGVDVKMITGDHTVIAKETSRQLGLGTNIRGAEDLPSLDEDGKIPKGLGEKYGNMIIEADGFAQVYPEHKYLIVEALRQTGFAVGMTGDGVNDAPALKRADCGIAVQGATDAARAAADIVLTEPGLSVVVEGIVIARCIFKRVQAFFNYRIAATMQIVTFFFVATFAFRPIIWGPPHQEGEEEWPEFFTLPVLLLLLITVLNDGTLITIAYDHVNPSPRPEKWNLTVLFIQSTVLAVVAMGSSLLLLWAMLDAWSPNSLLQRMGLPPPSYGQIVMSIYLKISLSDFLTLFASRTNNFFFTQRPGIGLFLGFLFAVSLSTILACLWPKMIFDHVQVEGLTQGEYKLWPLWVWIYCIVFFFVQDFLKVATYQLMFAFNAFSINTAKLINKRDAFTTKGKHGGLARASMCVVDEKLMGMKVDDAIEAVERANSSVGSDKSLQRVSQTLALARQSLQVIHESRGDPEAGGSNVEAVVSELQNAASTLDPASRLIVASKLSEVEKAAAKLKESQAAAKH